MKKVMAILLSVVMVFSMSFLATAATSNGFVSSPSTKPAPEVVTFEPADDECTAKLVITPYSEKEELSEALEALLDKAKDTITNSKNLTELNSKLASIAKSKNIKGEKLAVSDLFDIHVTGCDFHDGHVDFDIVLAADTLSHFVGLLHMNKDGVWELVEDAKVTGNGEHLVFSVESFSPFAIVVDTTELASNPPQTGDNSKIYLYIGIMAVSALAVLVIYKRLKKNACC